MVIIGDYQQEEREGYKKGCRCSGQFVMHLLTNSGAKHIADASPFATARIRRHHFAAYLVWSFGITGPEPTSDTLKVAAARLVIAAIRTTRSILEVLTSVSGQSALSPHMHQRPLSANRL